MSTGHRLRVLHVLDHSLPVGDGYSLRSHAILREQRRLGWETLQVTSPKHGADSIRREEAGGLLYLRTPPDGRFLSNLPVLDQWAVVAQLRAHIRRIVELERPDVIHAHSPCLNALAALELGVPLVYELRTCWEDGAVINGSTRDGSLRYRLSRWLETAMLRRADAVTTICEGLRAEVVRRGIAPTKVTVVPNGVDPADVGSVDEPTARLEKEKRGLQGKFVLGYVGSFFAWEGLSLLVEAMELIRQNMREAVLLLVGGGNEEQRLRGMVAARGLESHVVFVGRVPHAEVAGLYAAMDALVYPRLSMPLTDMVTPLKPLEAMAAGRLVVASNVGGHRELISDGQTGMLFDAGDACALSSTVLRLAGDTALQLGLRARARDYVVRERLWANLVPAYAAVYSGLKNRRSESPGKSSPPSRKILRDPKED